MKKYTRLICRIIVGILVLFMMLPAAVKVKAEEVEANLIKLEEEDDFTVMFTYEGERPEIVFISPSGKEYAEGTSTEAELLSSHGEGWSTYKVINAEAGQWRVRCDKKNNAEVEYSFVDEVDGLCIQSFDIISIEDGKANLSFDVTMGEDERIRYSYTITAILGEDTSVGNEVTSGSAYTGEVKELSFDLQLSSYEGYRFLLEVTAKEGLEMFDSMLSEEFDYINSNTPAAMEDFYTRIDMTNNWCELDWDEYDMGWNIEYQLYVVADGDTDNPIYTGSTTECKDVFSYPEGTKTLNISLYYRQNGVLSAPIVKELDLENGEALKLMTEDITGSSQLELFYNAAAQSLLSVSVNEQEGEYNIENSGTIYFPMEAGVNNIEAFFEGSNKITYTISKEIYFDTTPPMLKIYEDLDGKTFKSEKAVISGKVENAARLTINDVEIVFNEDGTFTYEQALNEGENIVTIVATSSSGIGITKNMLITKMKTASIVSTENELFPLIISLGISLVIIILAFIFLRNKEKTKKPVNIKRMVTILGIVTGVLDIISAVFFIYFYRINNSAGYLELVKESIKKASDYLTYQKIALITMLSCTGILAVIILVRVLFKKMSEKKNNVQSEDLNRTEK